METNIKKMLTVMLLVVFLSLAVVSAKTLIAGKIYNADWSEKVAGATVNVSCVHDSITVSNVTTSSSDGTYAISFYVDDCGIGDTATVYAFKAGVGEGTNTGVVNDKELFGIDCHIGVVNVHLIPEFGVVVGILTIMGALTAFFVIRRK